MYFSYLQVKETIAKLQAQSKPRYSDGEVEDEDEDRAGTPNVTPVLPLESQGPPLAVKPTNLWGRGGRRLLRRSTRRSWPSCRN